MKVYRLGIKDYKTGSIHVSKCTYDLGKAISRIKSGMRSGFFNYILLDDCGGIVTESNDREAYMKLFEEFDHEKLFEVGKNLVVA